MGIEYFSFEKVLKELQMDEDELKRLVSEGQIRAFRDEDKMKFRKDDIDNLKKGRQTEPTIILPPGGGEEKTGDDVMLVDDDTDETLLDLDDLGGGDLGEPDETAIPSLDTEEEEASSDTLTEELVFDEAADGTATDEVSTQETLIDEEDEEIGMTTEPLDLDEEEEEEEAKPKTVIARKPSATVRASARGSARAASRPVEVEDVTPAMLVLVLSASLILFLAGLFFIDILRVGFNPISGKIAAIVQGSFSGDGDAVWFKEREKKIDEEAEEEEKDTGGEDDGGAKPEEKSGEGD